MNLLDPKNWVDPETHERYRYFSREGKGYNDVLEWAREYEPSNYANREDYLKYKVVKQEDVFFGKFWVSTVWLGLDHQFIPDPPPLIFESMVFRKGSYGDLDMNRYTTEEEALKGHQELVRKWSNPFFIFWHVVWHEGVEDWIWGIRYRLKKLL